jgi:hypothetical protein
MSPDQHYKFSADAIASLRSNPPWIMGVDELAIVLDRSERAIRDDIRRGRIAHLRLGGAIKVRRADLEKSLQSLVRNPA